MSGYYAAWMMRLEGATTEEWMTEAENARQQFRLLAEECTDRSSQNYTAASENVEAVIRIEQMDLSTLMARPLPKNCCSNCNNLCHNKRKQAQGKRNQGESKSQKKGEDAREKIKKSNQTRSLSRGASLTSLRRGSSLTGLRRGASLTSLRRGSSVSSRRSSSKKMHRSCCVNF